MSTAAPVPQTHDLEGDDAFETMLEVGPRRLLRDSIARLRFADGFSHSRALAFQFALTLLPALIALVGLARVLGQEGFSDVLRNTVQDLAPGPAGEIVTRAFEHGSATAEGGPGALVLGALVALVSAATAMGQIERGANRIYGVERDRPTLRKYGLATALACTAGAATVIAFLILVPGGALGDALKDATGWSDALDTAWTVGRWPFGAVLVAGAVTLVFKLSPRRDQPTLSWLAVGSGISVLLWCAFTALLTLYVEVSRSFGETYGPLAGVIGLLIWALLTALALFLGLAVSAQLEAVRAGTPEPRAKVVAPGGSPS